MGENPKELWYVKEKDREIGMKPVYVEVNTKVLIAHGDPHIPLAQGMEISGLYRGPQRQRDMYGME